MSYRVEIVPSAEREFKRLPIQLQTRLRPKLIALEDNPRPRGTKRLKETDRYRLRVGDYRVIYSIDDGQRLVRILAIKHRRESYR